MRPPRTHDVVAPAFARRVHALDRRGFAGDTARGITDHMSLGESGFQPFDPRFLGGDIGDLRPRSDIDAVRGASRLDRNVECPLSSWARWPESRARVAHRGGYARGAARLLAS